MDAGDIGSGHTVTAFYEIETAGWHGSAPAETLRYAMPEPDTRAAIPSDEWLTVKLRYKLPTDHESMLIARPYTGVARDFHSADADFRFAPAVAMTALWLRDPEGAPSLRLESAATIAREALGSDPQSRRAEFVGLLDQLGARW